MSLYWAASWRITSTQPRWKHGHQQSHGCERCLSEGTDHRQENQIHTTSRQNLVGDTDLSSLNGRHQTIQYSNRYVHTAGRDIPDLPFNPSAWKERRWKELVQRRGQMQSNFDVQTTEAKTAETGKLQLTDRNYWKLNSRPGNPPYPAGMKAKMGYLRNL